MVQPNPGDMIYVISPPHKIHNRFRMVKFTFKVPSETMEVFFNKERSIPKLFKDRIRKEQAQESIVNPNKMDNSVNFTFDDQNKIDADSSTDFVVENSIVRKDTSVETGIVISIKTTTSSDVTQVHVLARGEVLDGATYFVRANTASDYQQITLDTLENIDSENQGKDLTIKIEISSANTRIDAIALLYK